MIVPFPPGGPADLIARVMAQKLSEDLGKQFYIENHAGAGGNIGVGVAARAPADGYSLHGQQPGHRHQPAASTSRCPTIPFKDLDRRHPHRDDAERRGRASVGAGQDHEGAGRADAKRRRQVPRLRASGPRHAGEPVRRAVPADAEPQPHLDPVRRRRADDPVGGRRPHAGRVLVAAAGGAADPGRPPARARRHRRQAATNACRTCRPWPRPAIPGQTGETPIGIFVPAGTPKEIVDLLHRKVVALVATAGRQGRSSPRSASRRSATRRRSSPPSSRPRTRSGAR